MVFNDENSFSFLGNIPKKALNVDFVSEMYHNVHYFFNYSFRSAQRLSEDLHDQTLSATFQVWNTLEVGNLRKSLGHFWQSQSYQDKNPMYLTQKKLAGIPFCHSWLHSHASLPQCTLD